jgi:DNA-binding transcriptional MocR family regulator
VPDDGQPPAWLPQLSSKTGPWAQRLADAIAEDVQAGRLVVGDRLPTQRALAQRLGVTPGTVNRAYAIAERAGLVTAEVGRGTFVTASSETGFHDTSVMRTATDAIELGVNYPAGTEAEAALDQALSQLTRRPPGTPLLSLSPYAGSSQHRAAGARWVRHLGLSVGGQDVLVTTGVQHGLAATLATLASPGDVVLTEHLTGPGLKAIAAVNHLRLFGIAGDDEGLMPDALTEACRVTGARVLYTMPTLHTPTTITMSEARRRVIADIVCRQGLTVIEDDAWGFLIGGAVTPLRALAPDRVVYLTTVSKCLAPGLRVGYAIPPASLQRAITASIGGLTWTPPVMAELVSRWIMDGTAEAISGQRIRTAAERQHLARKLIGLDLVCSPTPAFHHWLPLSEPWRVQDFVAHAAIAGVSLAAPDVFVPGRASTPNAVRLCTATEPDLRRVERGLRIIAGMLKAGPMRAPATSAP